MTLPPPIPMMKTKSLLGSSRRTGSPHPHPLVDVANTHGRPISPTGTRDTAKSTQHSPRRASRAPGSQSSLAVPFPTISEEGGADVDVYVHDSSTEEARGREWAKEIARRQANIKELRGKKLRLEQTQAANRPRKTNPLSSGSSYSSYITSLDRKLSADDIDFIAALHASVVWRLWHAELTPAVFASERLLATRLHLVLMRHGRQNIPVPPIVALAQSHHMHSQTSWTRHMIEKDRPGIQTLPQLVAKSMLRQKKTQGRRSPSRSGPRSSASKEKGPSPLSREATTI